MSGTLYTSWKDALGASHIDEPVAVFENGKIYTAADGFLGTTAKGVLIGEYEGGIVYTVGTGAFNYGKRLKAVALIEYGKIYSLSKSILGGISKSLSVGEYSCGKIYSHSHKLIEGSESFGLYNGDEEGAAAAAAIVLFGLTSGVSAYDSSLESDDSGAATYSRKSSHSSGDDSGSGMGCFFSIIAGVIIFAVSALAIIISLVAFVPTFLVYLLVKFIIKRTREEAVVESDEQKRKEFVIVLVVSMLIALTMTVIAAFDSGDMVLPCIGSAIVEAIGFGWLITFVKSGKEIKFLKRFKRKKKESTETESYTYEDTTVTDDISSETAEEIIPETHTEKTSSEMYHLDDDKAVIASFDEDGKLVSETWGHIEKDDSKKVEIVETTETEVKVVETPKSRLKSTMRTHSADDVTESDKFTPGGDL